MWLINWGLFVCCDKIIHCHMNNITVYCTDKVVVFFYWKLIDCHYLFIHSLFLLFFDRIFKTFQNWFQSFLLRRFSLFWILESCHRCRQCCWCIAWLLICYYCYWTPLKSFFYGFDLLFISKVNRLRVKVSVP